MSFCRRDIFHEMLIRIDVKNSLKKYFSCIFLYTFSFLWELRIFVPELSSFCCCSQMNEMQYRRKLSPNGLTHICRECPVAYLTSTTTWRMDTCSPGFWRSSAESFWWEHSIKYNMEHILCFHSFHESVFRSKLNLKNTFSKQLRTSSSVKIGHKEGT